AAGKTGESAPQRIVELQEEMRTLAAAILALPAGPSQWTDADAYVALMRQRLARKLEADTTSWALDGDEDADEVVLAESGIPNELELVRELIRMVPDGTDRKFDTLVRAIEQVRAGNAD